MIPYIIAAGVGFVINELIRSNKPKETTKKNEDFFVYVRTNDFDKTTLTFYDYGSAKTMYDKFVSAKKVRYKDLVDNSPAESKLYNKWKNEGNIGKEGYPSSLSATSKIQEVVFGKGNNEYESKEFK